MPSSPPSSIHLDLKESDVIKMTLEFLQNRDLHISQLSLERETGVINAHYSDDLLFLRQLILDGQWEDVLEFVQPLEGLEGFQAKKFKFIILKHKFVELLCIKGEVGGGLSHVEEAMEEVVSVLRQIEAVAASKEEYSALCLLLTAPRLTEHAEFRDWNPSKARVSCFRAVLPLVERFLALEPRKGSLSQSEIARNDRLMQLVIKGMLYEACVEFCQAKATKSSSGKAMFFTRPLSPQSLSDADLSLISWLQALPAEHFTIPFEPKALNVDVERLERPFLETSWTEHILVTPIKPAQVFPHSAMPYSRPKSADLMTRSLNLYRSLTTAAPPAALGGATPASVAEMTRSLASFHLTGRRSMDTSVDRLFEQATPTTGLTPIPETPAKDQPAPQPKKSPPAANGGTPNGPPHPRPSTTGGNQDLLREFQRQKRSSEAPNGQPLVSVITPCGTTRGVSPSSVSTMSHSANANSQVLPQNGSSGTSPKTHFTPVTTLEDAQAVRCAEFHPDGKVFAVGSNSKTLRLCAYPEISDLSSSGPSPANVLFKRTRHHKGSIYCMAWSPDGALLATGSNDKTVKLLKYNSNACNFDGHEVELTMHDGTVRDVCFIEDMSNQSSLLVSGGAGDCKIYVTDCATGTPFQALSGHSGHVLSLYTWGGAMFVSGSMDKSIRFWDLRTRGCVNVITPQTMAHPGVKGSPVASLAVDPSGRLLVSGHEDSTCVLFDFRGNRVIQTFSPHTADVRSIRFSPSAYYLLTAGYDNKLVLSDLQDDLTLPLPSIVVAEHQDKVISGRWHPRDFSFISTSADKTAVLWGLPAI